MSERICYGVLQTKTYRAGPSYDTFCVQTPVESNSWGQQKVSGLPAGQTPGGSARQDDPFQGAGNELQYYPDEEYYPADSDYPADEYYPAEGPEYYEADQQNSPAVGQLNFAPAQGQLNFASAQGQLNYSPAQGQLNFPPAQGEFKQSPAQGELQYAPAQGQLQPAPAQTGLQPAVQQSFPRTPAPQRRKTPNRKLSLDGLPPICKNFL